MRRIVREATLHPRLQSLFGPHELPTVYSYHPVGKERRGQEWPSRYELTVQESNTGGGGVFRSRPYRPWGSPRLLYNGNQLSSWGQSGRGVVLTPLQSSSEFKERVELYLCFPSGPSGPVIGWTFTFTFTWRKIPGPRTDSCWPLLFITVAYRSLIVLLSVAMASE